MHWHIRVEDSGSFPAQSASQQQFLQNRHQCIHHQRPAPKVPIGIPVAPTSSAPTGTAIPRAFAPQRLSSIQTNDVCEMLQCRVQWVGILDAVNVYHATWTCYLGLVVDCIISIVNIGDTSCITQLTMYQSIRANPEQQETQQILLT